MTEAVRLHRMASVAIPAIAIGRASAPPAFAASIVAKIMYEAALSKSALLWVRICVINEEFRAVFATAFGVDQQGSA
jgi:O-acetyl-ADP-ribose deacetylase (regulator of RNase III)